MSDRIEPESSPRTPPLRVSPRHLGKLEKALRLTLQPSAEHDPPFAIWISGDPGTGKSTLVAAATAVVEGEGAVMLGGEAYRSTTEVLEPVLTAARQLIERTRAAAARGAPGWSRAWEDIVECHAPALDPVLPEVDWGRDVSPFPDIAPEFERNRLLDHLAGLFLRVAADVPLFLRFEGAEYLDGLSRELLQTLGRVVRSRRQGARAGLPLPPAPRLAVLLLTTETDHLPLELGDDEVLPMVLGGIGRDELARLLEEELGEEIPLSVREKLYQKCRGNALDITSRLRWERRLEPAAAEVRAKRLLDFGSFEEECRRELRELPDEARRVAQALALLEKPVSRAILSEIVGDDSATERGLACLAAGDWIVEATGDVVRLGHERFSGPILATVPDPERPERHRRAAEVLVATYRGRRHRRFQEAHHHYSSGPQDPEAVEAGFAAAAEARRLYDFRGAVRLYRELLEGLDDEYLEQAVHAVSAIAELLLELSGADERLLIALEQEVRAREKALPPTHQAALWRRLGSVAGRWGLHDKEATFFTRGVEIIEGAGPCQERLLLYAAIARACLRHREYDETLHYCREGLELSRLQGLSDDPEFLEICHVTEQAHFHRGEYVEAQAFEEQYLDLSRRTGTPMQTIESLLRLAHLHDRRSDPETARQRLLDAMPVARATGSRLLEARIDERLGYLHSRSEEWTAATDAFQRALQIHTEIGEEGRTVRLFGALGMVSLFTGEATAGARAFRLYALYQGLRSRPELPAQVPGLPCDYRSRAEREEEIKLREETLARAKRLPSRTVLDAMAELGELRRDRGELQLARATLRRGQRLAVAEQADVGRYHLQLGILHRMQGEVQAALGDFQKGLKAMTSFPDRERVAEINLQVGLLHLGRGEYGRALASVVRGLRGYLELDHETGVTHALIQLGHVYHQIGEREAAEELGLAALALADTLRIDRLEAEAWLLLGAVRSGDEGNIPGHHEVTIARELFHRLGILEGRCRALLAEAAIFHRWDDMARALSLVSEALEIARDLGLGPQIAHGLALRGALEGDRRTPGGDFLRAMRTLENAHEHAKTVGDRRLLLRIHAILARLYEERTRGGGVQTHVDRVRHHLEHLLAATPRPFQALLERNHEGVDVLRHRAGAAAEAADVVEPAPETSVT